MRLTIFITCFLATSIAVAQPGDPGGGGNPTVPVSGIELLIGAGAAYGISRKWLRKKQRNG
jgi:hypothetical protein